MVCDKAMKILKPLMFYLRQKAALILMAFMLGASNVILDEMRSVNDTRERIEQKEVHLDEDSNETFDYRPDF